MGSPVTLVTPSFSGDYDRFVFQRESMARCGIDLPQVVIAHEEDLALFRRTPFRDRLTVLSSRDVLAPEIERRQRDGNIDGWSFQQLVKLAAADVLDTDYVCVDSDAFWVRPVTAVDFHATSGELYLFEYHLLSTEILRWLSNSLELLGVSQDEKIVPVFCVNAIVPLALELVRDLRVELERRYATSWCQAMLDHDVVEYTIYGVYARYLRRLEGLVPTEPDFCIGYWERQFEQFDSHFPEEALRRGVKAGMVHSRLGLSPDDYRGTVERVWRELAE